MPAIYLDKIALMGDERYGEEGILKSTREALPGVPIHHDARDQKNKRETGSLNTSCASSQRQAYYSYQYSKTPNNDFQDAHGSFFKRNKGGVGETNHQSTLVTGSCPWSCPWTRHRQNCSSPSIGSEVKDIESVSRCFPWGQMCVVATKFSHVLRWPLPISSP